MSNPKNKRHDPGDQLVNIYEPIVRVVRRLYEISSILIDTSNTIFMQRVGL
jgi:hypothetical protein